jgi:polygalacturonase
MSRRQVVGMGAALAGAAVAAPVLANTALAGTAATPATADPFLAPITPMAGAGYTVAPSDLPWPAAQTIVAETKVTSFPDATFDVTKYGAKGSGGADNTAAFKAAIAACNAAGGGHVVVPAGTYVTGAVHLLSNVDFHLEAGATLRFSGTASNFPVVLTRYEGIECMNHSPMVYAYGQQNIALTGSGTLDAGGTSSWNKGSERSWLEGRISAGVTDPHQRVVPGSGHNMRSTFIEPYNCDRVLIQDVTLKNSMFWQLHPTLCTNVIIDGVTTDASTAHSNTDGCDPESSDHVIIRNCTLGAHDDNIAIKSGRDADGRRVNVPTQNLVVYNCLMNGNWGAITCGSEQTGGIRNVYAYKCRVIGATKFALYVKSNTRRGGFSQNINLDSFTGTFVRSFVFVTTTYNGQTGNFPPQFGPFTISNSGCTKAAQAFNINGLSSPHIKGFVVRDSSFNGVSNTGNTLKNIDGLSFTNVKINGKTVTG